MSTYLMSKIIKVVLSAVFVLSPLGVTLAQENIAPISTDRAVSTENEAINENPSANDASR